MSEERFITFKDIQGIEHTYRIIDIQAVGVDSRGGNSYVRAFNDLALTVPREEAVRIRARWLQEG